MLTYDSIQTMEGTPGIRLMDIAHGIIPGRGRAKQGTALSPQAIHRVDYASGVYDLLDLDTIDGVMVSSGGKNPSDPFDGLAEAELQDARFEVLGVIRAINRRVERDSIDAATNFTRSQSHFPDDERPVAIYAQEEQLERIIEKIAPKTMRRHDYIGIVVPADPKFPDTETLASALFSKAVLLGITTRMSEEKAIKKTDFRARKLWGLVKALHLNSGAGEVYNQDKQ